MSYQLQATPARRPSWRGILAGLLMGLVVWFAMFSLALILSSFLSLDLQGASITGGIYTIVTALLSAFTAGYLRLKPLRQKPCLVMVSKSYPKMLP